MFFTRSYSEREKVTLMRVLKGNLYLIWEFNLTDDKNIFIEVVKFQLLLQECQMIQKNGYKLNYVQMKCYC